MLVQQHDMSNAHLHPISRQLISSPVPLSPLSSDGVRWSAVELQNMRLCGARKGRDCGALWEDGYVWKKVNQWGWSLPS